MANYNLPFRVLALSWVLWICGTQAVLLAQNSKDKQTKKYFVFLKDKEGTPYSLDNPLSFLSQRALDRRVNREPAIDISLRDLPVNPDYVAQIKATGAEVWYASKWFNAVMVSAEQATLDQISALPIVTRVQTLTEKSGTAKKTYNYVPNTTYDAINTTISSPDDYGQSLNQVTQIGVDEAHKQGYRGKGMYIAVFDSGFEKADKLLCFQHLFANNQILGTYNFLENNEYVFGNGGEHGTMVLSTMAAFLKGKLIGTAPDASYFLFKTEDTGSENPVEEVHWIMAAERADSAGVDVINSSLGYTDYDDKSMSYTYNDLNGNTALITRAADIAAGVGMIVVSSAGNEGGGKWQYVSTPADADSIISVGAVDKNGKYVYFSSTGNTADGRVKPNLAAKGMGSTVCSPGGDITSSSGTSFSSPILCGMVADFWQANPKLNNMQVIDYLQQSGNQADKPDSLLGFGIPHFGKAMEIVNQTNGKKKKRTGSLLQGGGTVPHKRKLDKSFS